MRGVECAKGQVASRAQRESADASFARTAPAPGWIALPLCRASESDGEFFTQADEITLNTAFPANQDMVVIGQPFAGQCGAQQFPEPALHPIADDRVADLLGYGDAKALAQSAVGPGQQHKTGARHAQAPVGGKKVSAAFNDRDYGRIIRQLRRRASCGHAHGGHEESCGHPE